MSDTRIPCEVVSRVCGYLAPVENWNIGKRAEYQDRVVFNITVGEDHDIRGIVYRDATRGIATD